MKIIFEQPEPKSPTKGAWSKIDEKALYSKKIIVGDGFRSKAFRFPEETVSMRPEVARRKEAARIRIETMRANFAKYRA
jgi:hypothetical protein